MKARETWGLVLAGGESRRMGTDKAMLRNGGLSQLAHLYALLDSVTARTFVSTRASQKDDSERARYPQIIDSVDDVGPIAGVLSALRAYPRVNWLVLACDLPNIDAAMLRNLLGQHDDRHPFTAYESSYDGLPEPLCAVYGATAEGVISSFVEAGIVCPRKMLIRSDTRLLKQLNPRSLDNVNTPDDLADSVLENVL